MIAARALRREIKISLTVKGLTKLLFSIIGFLVFADLLDVLFRRILLYRSAGFNFFDEYFNLDYEFNVPSLFAFFILFLSSALLFFIRITNKTKEANLYWLSLSVIFLFLSFDEIFSVHEKISRALSQHIITDDLHGTLLSAWVLPYGILCLVFAFAFMKLVFSLPRRTARVFILSGCVYIFGALGLEILEGYIKTRYGDILIFKLITTIEETLEMSGIVTFIYGLLDYIAPHHSKITIVLKQKARALKPMPEPYELRDIPN